jgi:hypothetical protein
MALLAYTVADKGGRHHKRGIFYATRGVGSISDVFGGGVSDVAATGGFPEVGATDSWVALAASETKRRASSTIALSFGSRTFTAEATREQTGRHRARSFFAGAKRAGIFFRIIFTAVKPACKTCPSSASKAGP